MTIDFHVHFVTDCTDHYAKTDVMMALQIAAQNIGSRYKSTFMPVGKFDWVELSYAAAHHYGLRKSLTSKLSDKTCRDIIIVNAAPPKSSSGKDAGDNNERDNFVLATLNDGTVLAGTKNGLTLLKSHIKELFEFSASNNGSQFRSRDVLPEIALLYAKGYLHKNPKNDETQLKALQHLALRLMKDEDQANITAFDQPALLTAQQNMLDSLIELDPMKDIPDFPNHSVVVQIDEPFSNVKIKLCKEDRVHLREIFDHTGSQGAVSVRFSCASLVDEIEPSFKSKVIEAKILPRLFDADEGDVVFTLGSSSHIINDKGNKEFMAQLVVLQRRTDSPIPYTLPRIGSAVKLVMSEKS